MSLYDDMAVNNHGFDCANSPFFLCQPPPDPCAYPQPIDARRSVLRLKDIRLGMGLTQSSIYHEQSTRRDHSVLAGRVNCRGTPNWPELLSSSRGAMQPDFGIVQEEGSSLYQPMPGLGLSPMSPVRYEEVLSRSSDRIRALQAALGGSQLTDRYGKAPPVQAPYYASGALTVGTDTSFNAIASPLRMVAI